MLLLICSLVCCSSGRWQGSVIKVFLLENRVDYYLWKIISWEGNTWRQRSGRQGKVIMYACETIFLPPHHMTENGNNLQTVAPLLHFMKNWPPGGTTCIGCNFSYQIAPDTKSNESKSMRDQEVCRAWNRNLLWSKLGPKTVIYYIKRTNRG